MFGCNSWSVSFNWLDGDRALVCRMDVVTLEIALGDSFVVKNVDKFSSEVLPLCK